jgi:type IX secretion system PorP/SprF family membrane protein
MRRFTLFLIVSVVAAAQSFAQQDPRFTHYFYNQQYFNPAAAGLDGNMKFMLLGRTQWAGYSQQGTAPNTGLLSFNTPLLQYQSGVGAVVYYESFAAVTALAVRANYAYHLPIGAGKLSFGISPGVVSQGRDASKYKFNDQGDAAIPASINSSQFDLGAGIYYKTERYFIGLSSLHLTAPVFNFGNDSAEITLNRHYYGIVGYNYEVNPSLTLTPSVLVKSADFNGKATSVEGNITANINNRFSVGAGYTQQEAVNVLLGVSLLQDNSLRFGYALDLITNGADAKQSSSHELMLAYQIPVILKGPKPAIRTPRYRK